MKRIADPELEANQEAYISELKEQIDLQPTPLRGNPRHADSSALQIRQLRVALKQLEQHIQNAEKSAYVGTRPPNIARFGGLLGRVIRFSGWIVQRLANFVTREQRQFNLAVLECICDLHKVVHHWDQADTSQEKNAQHVNLKKPA